MGPILLKVYTNNPGDGTECILSKFVDNTKLEKAVNVLKGRAATQWDLDKLKIWVTRNIMRLHKSKIPRIGWNNTMQHYRLGLNHLGSSSGKRVVGLLCGQEAHYETAACVCKRGLH